MAEHRSHGTSLRESNRSSDNHNNGEAHNKPKTIAAAPAAAPVQGRSPSLPHTPRSPHSRAQAEVKLVRALREELEANRANLTVEKRKELARKLLEHRGKDDTFFTRLNRRMEQVGCSSDPRPRRHERLQALCVTPAPHSTTWSCPQ